MQDEPATFRLRVRCPRCSKSAEHQLPRQNPGDIVECPACRVRFRLEEKQIAAAAARPRQPGAAPGRQPPGPRQPLEGIDHRLDRPDVDQADAHDEHPVRRRSRPGKAARLAARAAREPRPPGEPPQGGEGAGE